MYAAILLLIEPRIWSFKLKNWWSTTHPPYHVYRSFKDLPIIPKLQILRWHFI